ncbi:hydrogenase 2 operon protein HybA [Pelobacter seleniigenes]|uniref:hydrogenase 2 operon protein HybA n=1 Tax=Pelobacter seleniigenes TaxID=407188 RepID=UPI0004A6ADDB|nr:hydrogenase 2 operon protein HybA [Pelobacter seleniigenes]
MDISRRKFFKLTAVGGAAVCSAATPAAAQRQPVKADPDWYGMLNDSTRCIGCKACQVACKKENGLPPEASFDEGLYDSPRELSQYSYTLIKMYRDQQGEATFVKRQCMHCIDPACQSACIVGALKKTADGSVQYDAKKCMGCRYCMVACPFNVPQFEWQKAIPTVKKCNLCSNSRIKHGMPTACAAACPAGAIVFGKRQELLEIARQRIRENPDRYDDHIYGEHEVGGTDVLYLTKKNVAFASLGLGDFEDKPVSSLTESIQHRIFQYFIPPIAVYTILGGIMVYNNRRKTAKEQRGEHDE